MSISSALSSATSGLSAASARANVVSNNIANALTPGYARRDVSVSENVVAGQGAGVVVKGVSRATDVLITGALRRANAEFSLAEETSSAYKAFNTALGEPEDPFSLFAQFENLESSLRASSQTPESPARQAAVVDTAKALTQSLNGLSDLVQSTRQNADAAIARQVGFVNDALQQIEDLNETIAGSGVGGRDTSALEDQRKQLIDQISKIISVKEIARDRGKIDLMTDEGVFLLAGKVRQLSFTQTGTITADMSYGGGVLSGLSVDGVDITPGGGATLAPTAGSIVGLFKVRDEIAPAFQTQIDAVARDVIERFEGVDPTLAPGAAGLFTDAGGPFNPALETGLAGRIAVNPAVDADQGGELWRLRDGLGAAAPGAAGDASLLNALLDSFTLVRTPPPGVGISGQHSGAGVAAGLSTSIGSSRIAAESRLASRSAQAQSLSDAETAATAVDTDQELQRMLLIEQSYAANARVIQVASQMIERLMEL